MFERNRHAAAGSYSIFHRVCASSNTRATDLEHSGAAAEVKADTWPTANEPDGEKVALAPNAEQGAAGAGERDGGLDGRDRGRERHAAKDSLPGGGRRLGPKVVR